MCKEKPGLVELEDQEAEEARAKAESGVSRVCMHQRWRIFCAECGGSGLCPHGKRKGTCKTCGGTQFCEHKRLRRQCRYAQHVIALTAASSACTKCWSTGRVSYLQSVIRSSPRAAAVVVMSSEQAITFLCALSMITDSMTDLQARTRLILSQLAGCVGRSSCFAVA